MRVFLFFFAAPMPKKEADPHLPIDVARRPALSRERERNVELVSPYTNPKFPRSKFPILGSTVRSASSGTPNQRASVPAY